MPGRSSLPIRRWRRWGSVAPVQPKLSVDQPAIKVLALGLAGGIIGGFFGVGGGIVLVPLIVYVLKGDQHTAHATSLGAIVLISAASALRYGLDGNIDLDFGLALGVGGVVGSMIGATAMHRLSPNTLRLVFALVLIVVGVRMVM